MHCCEGSEPNGGEGRGEERTGVGGRRAAEDAIDNQGGRGSARRDVEQVEVGREWGGPHAVSEIRRDLKPRAPCARPESSDRQGPTWSGARGPVVATSLAGGV